MSLRRKLAYCLGSPGWQIASSLVTSVGLYFYLPPEGAGLTPRLSQELFLGIFTAYGVARLVGGVADSLADPVVGHWCDRSRSRWGRRRFFLMIGVAPMVGAAGLLFWPAGEAGSLTTFVSLTLTLSAFYVFFTMYVGPYLSLVPELARTEEDRIELSRLRALVGGPVVLVFGVTWLKGMGWGQAVGLTAEESIRIVVAVSCVLSFVLCLLPIFAVDESRFTRTTRSDLPWRTAISITLRNRSFLAFLCAQVTMILGYTMVFPSIPYLSRVVLGRDESFAGTLTFALVPLISVGFATIDRVGARWGIRRTMVTNVALLGLAAGSLGLVVPDVPGGPNDTWNLVVVVGALAVMGWPLASIVVLPMVMLGQLIDLDESKTGATRSAMYFGVQGLFTKWAYAASAAIMSFLFASYGVSAAEPLGVVLVGPVAGSLCLVSAVLFALYPDPEEGGRVEEVNG